MEIKHQWMRNYKGNSKSQKSDVSTVYIFPVAWGTKKKKKSRKKNKDNNKKTKLQKMQSGKPIIAKI